MPEAVIVSAVRSPIGRAMKGSLKSLRPDDMAAQMVAAALAKVPELDPAEIDDLLLAAASPPASPASTSHGPSRCSSATTSCRA